MKCGNNITAKYSLWYYYVNNIFFKFSHELNIYLLFIEVYDTIMILFYVLNLEMAFLC